jgi:hypothetical protein
MAETQVASSGWGGEFHFHDGTSLYEAVQVVSFTLPNPEYEEEECTHLKSEDRMREYIDTLINGGEVEIVLNYRPGSDTDTKLLAWRTARAIRAVKFVIPESGVAAYEIDATAKCMSIDRGTVTADGKMEVTVTARICSLETQTAA